MFNSLINSDKKQIVALGDLVETNTELEDTQVAGTVELKGSGWKNSKIHGVRNDL